MSEIILTVVDVRQVQKYLFSANELKQNLGGSYLVEQAIRDWVHGELPQPHNWPDPRLDVFTDEKIEEGHLAAEVIFSGGGNTAILFSNLNQAKAFTTRYTRVVLQQAPGLEVAVGHTPFDMSQDDGLKLAWQEMQQHVMPARKEGRATSQPLLGLSVTAECAYTGLPAVDELGEDGLSLLAPRANPTSQNESPRGTLVSAEALARSQAAPNAHQRLNALFPLGGFYEYPQKFDDLGGEHGRASYIAVIHLDGNQMGKRVQNYTAQAADSRDSVVRMRSFSEKVNQAGKAAVTRLRDIVLRALPDDEAGSDELHDRWRPADLVRLVDGCVPYLPLVYGGDDITLVTEGRLGWWIASLLLREFAAESLEDGEKLFACAGVAVVHSHYPFARAYQLAEDLCQEAKRQARQQDPEHARLSLLHWYPAIAGQIAGDWQAILQAEYSVSAKSLALRPLAVAQHPQVDWQAHRTWQAFMKQVEGFRSPPWSQKRNKVKDLRLALRQGADATMAFTSLHGELPDPGAALTGVRQRGWDGSQCIYFDALEADDLLVYPLER